MCVSMCAYTANVWVPNSDARVSNVSVGTYEFENLSVYIKLLNIKIPQKQRVLTGQRQKKKRIDTEISRGGKIKSRM